MERCSIHTSRSDTKAMSSWSVQRREQPLLSCSFHASRKCTPRLSPPLAACLARSTKSFTRSLVAKMSKRTCRIANVATGAGDMLCRTRRAALRASSSNPTVPTARAMASSSTAASTSSSSGTSSPASEAGPSARACTDAPSPPAGRAASPMHRWASSRSRLAKPTRARRAHESAARRSTNRSRIFFRYGRKRIGAAATSFACSPPRGISLTPKASEAPAAALAASTNASPPK
mmetsp:Transcript_28516/g.92464  ORF Transcript_28516/g.92464 Transcript_28516/m.92464 type:complete len:233 (-) Transcript_28516:1449-2147(-)